MKPTAAAIALLAALGAASAAAQEAPRVEIELNKLEQAGEACQVFLVIGNRTDGSFSSLNLDLVFFDADGVIARRLAVETAPLPARKTSVRAFAVEGLDCGGIGRVLLNTVLTCEADGAARDDCLGLVETASRADAEFFR